ncbi:MAG: hypothetical protein HRU40_07480 [Saprospiraceae bacterium]|nr:hypothetical protein [Saprospiraceae bacterium]
MLSIGFIPCYALLIDLKMENIRKKVYNFKTKNKEGFVQSEIDTLLKDYPNINIDKFNSALRGITCMMINDETVIYHCDIYKALRCGTENRNLRVWEWD